MNKIFREKLEELMNEFPEYYIEIWGPDDFYKHKAMTDGRLGKCKACRSEEHTSELQSH